MSAAVISLAERRHNRDSFMDELVLHLDVLYRVARRLTRHAEDTEDLVQETVARALARRAQYQPGTNLRAWLLTIERSLFVSGYRHAQRRPVTQSIDEMEEGILHDQASLAHSPSAETTVLHNWVDPDLVAALKALPEPYRVAVVLSDVQGLSYAEMAQRMNCPAGTVMSRLHRGRALLRKALADRGGAPEVAAAAPAFAAQALPAAA